MKYLMIKFMASFNDHTECKFDRHNYFSNFSRFNKFSMNFSIFPSYFPSAQDCYSVTSNGKYAWCRDRASRWQ
jgi:hypothetical protein